MPISLISSFCTSGQMFAASFLQIPTLDGHPCSWLYTSRYRACYGLAPLRECSCWANRVGGKRSSFLPTFVFRPLTPPYVPFGIRRFLSGSSCLMSFRISGHCPFPCYTLTAEAWEGFRFGFGMLLRGPLHRVRDNTTERQGVASAAPYQSTVSPSSNPS